MHTMKRFEDPTLISILQTMRKRQGAKLTNGEWQALLDTELETTKLEQDPETYVQETTGWFESCYLWSIVSMASHARTTISAREPKQVVLYCQAVDFSQQILRHDKEIYARMLAVPNLGNTSRLPYHANPTSVGFSRRDRHSRFTSCC